MNRLPTIPATTLALLLAAAALPAFAAGVIQGQITSAEDETPIAGAKVILLAAEVGLIQSTQTDAQGEYRFTNLPPATYDVKAEAPPKFGSFRRPGIPLRGDRTLRINLPLLPREWGAVNEVEPPPEMDPTTEQRL